MKRRSSARPVGTANCTGAALRAKIQREMQIEAIVDADGAVVEPRVIRSLDDDYGLDAPGLVAGRRGDSSPRRGVGSRWRPSSRSN